MDSDFLRHMKERLNGERQDIIANLMAGNEDFKQIMEGQDPKDQVDSAADDIDRKMIEALGAQDLRRLKQIESALTRIDQGKYGLCIKCSKKIPQERLDAMPYALMCIECKSAEERRNR
jgi:RNA polymerase-binding protein DksA